MTNTLDKQRIELGAGMFNHRIATSAFAREKAYLDEFMRSQRAVNFGEHGVGQTGRAGLHNHVEIVSEAAQVLAVFFSQFGIGHDPERVDRPSGRVV